MLIYFIFHSCTTANNSLVWDIYSSTVFFLDCVRFLRFTVQSSEKDVLDWFLLTFKLKSDFKIQAIGHYPDWRPG